MTPEPAANEPNEPNEPGDPATVQMAEPGRGGTTQALRRQNGGQPETTSGDAPQGMPVDPDIPPSPLDRALEAIGFLVPYETQQARGLSHRWAHTGTVFPPPGAVRWPRTERTRCAALTTKPARSIYCASWPNSAIGSTVASTLPPCSRASVSGLCARRPCPTGCSSWLRLIGNQVTLCALRFGSCQSGMTRQGRSGSSTGNHAVALARPL